MSDYVLVHGSWHGAWAWERVAPMLTAAGHEVRTPDLPGRVGDGLEPSEVTLSDHVDRVASELDAFGRPAILVGHSFGGFVISHVAERLPERIGLLVYLAAFLLGDGETVLGASAEFVQETSHLDIREKEGLIAVRPEAARRAFYDDCPEDDAERATARLVPESLAPRRTPARLTDGRFGRVPRVYVETVNDRALSPMLQRRMYTTLPCREVVQLRSGHSPFLALPGALAEHLLAWGDVGTMQEPSRRSNGS